MNEQAITSASQQMSNRIATELAAIERAHGVRILYACESGSRAWGFASENSDYDVRFIYAHEPEWYLRLKQQRDVIEWALDEVLDINGWDLSKTLRLMRASNPTVFEWLNSPIIYHEDGVFSKVRELSCMSFAPRPTIYHYLNMARKNRAEHLATERVKLKKYFYVMRSLLAARWVAEKRTAPPVPFAELVREELEPEMRPLFAELVRQKTHFCESGVVPRIPELDMWIEGAHQEVETSIPDVPPFDKPGWAPYDRTFFDILGNVIDF